MPLCSNEVELVVVIIALELARFTQLWFLKGRGHAEVGERLSKFQRGLFSLANLFDHLLL